MKISINNSHKSVIVALLIVLLASVFSGCSKGVKPSEVLEQYKVKWQQKDYQGMYSMLSAESKGKISQEDFINRYTNIYNGIEAENINISYSGLEEADKSKDSNVSVPFSMTMDTLAGNIEVNDYTAMLLKEEVDGEKTWAIDWNEGLIFPKMESGDKVGAQSYSGKRGGLYDRNGGPLAVTDTIISLGVHYGNFTKNKAANMEALAKVLDISTETIEKKLQGYSDPEMFVPIVKVLPSSTDLLARAMAIEGVIHQKITGRVYPGGEAFGSLIGNLGAITAEELEKLAGEGYSSTDYIGKRGLEQVYDKRLKGENGGIIYISKQKDGKETEKIVIAEKKAIDGEDITLSIDSELQKSIYAQIKNDFGSASAVHPKTGEVLALVSAPSFDSNYFSTYVPASVAKQWEDNNNAAFTNRFKLSYAPGSVFKLLTGAIGLDTGKIKPSDTINVSGLQWQKDSSWGSYKVTRVKDAGGPVDLKKAFMYSDNIYFAQAALNIGGATLAEELTKRFGLGEEFPFVYPMGKSQVSNSGTIDRDILLADSGYGQGEVLMTPLHVALAFSAVANDGNIMTPVLEGQNFSIWKEGSISKDTISILKEDLTAVVDSPSGTGNDAKIPGVSLAGKTGTAELKKDASDTQADEYGWFAVMNNDDPKIVLTMMVERVKNRGGSHYVSPKLRL